VFKAFHFENTSSKTRDTFLSNLYKRLFYTFP